MSTIGTNSAIPAPSQSYLDRGYGAANNLEAPAHTQNSQGKFNEEWDASQRGSSIIDGQYASITFSHVARRYLDSLERWNAEEEGFVEEKWAVGEAQGAGSVRSLAVHPQGDIDELHSAFYSPVPTSGNPTEILANRFQSWLSNVINNTTAPSAFLPAGGIDDALQILRNYHKSAIAEANKSRDIEQDVILALTGFAQRPAAEDQRDQGLSGDFKNSVDKEMEATRKAVTALQEGLDWLWIVRSRSKLMRRITYTRHTSIWKPLDANSRQSSLGRFKKSYNALAGILKREADGAYNAVDELRTGPIAMPKDHEWTAFVENDEHFIDPKIPVRRPEIIRYPGQDNELAGCIREGLLERKSKFLKSYTPGWYVLSPTHLHEFRSADKLQAPIMSLYLPEQKLGSHSNEGGSSNKFILKGRQTGTLHRGHSWVFRAETRDTLLAWYEDIKTLTEKSPQERNAFVRQHARSVSGTSQRANSISSDGVMDEEDEEPFSTNASAIVGTQGLKQEQKRPEPGGRFPSDLQVNAARGLQAPLSPSSGSSLVGGDAEDAVVAAAALPASGVGQHYGEDPNPASPTHAQMINQAAKEDGVNPYTYEPIQNMNTTHDDHHELPAAAAVGLGGAAVGAAGTAMYHEHELQKQREQAAMEATVIAAPDTDQLREQADREAALIAAPDDHVYEGNAQQQADLAATATATAAPDTNMSGGRSLGDISAAPWFNEAQETAALTAAVPNPEPKSAETIFDPLAQDLERPTLAAGQNHQSVGSISQLHVPGEFPRARTDTESSFES
ncbi:hypothetical protein EYC84_008936 [Monilinia fructicola]|nr:hypothetical protein EYC84_008936 [Monilinia fructicola]